MALPSDPEVMRSKRAPRYLLFAPFRLDCEDERLWRQDQVIRLSPKAFALLHHLASHPEHLLTKDELFATVWPETAVSEAVLTTTVRQVRQALDDQARNPRFIETVHGRGYRFIARVEPQEHIAVTGTATSAAPAQSAEVGTHSLVGREREWACLQQWYDRTQQGTRQIGFIAGEAGIGKTALVEAFVSSRATAEHVLVGHGQCIKHFGAGEAYLPILEALGRLGRCAPYGARLVELLHAQAPSWLIHLPALLPPDERGALAQMTQHVTPTRMLRELADVLDVFTAMHPLILVFEDLHWSDPATLEWLAYVARRRDAARLLILGTYRPVQVIVQSHPLHTVIAELRQHPQCAELVLEYLSETQVATYLQQRWGSMPGLQALAHVLHRRTSGHPLFLVTLVDELLRQRTVSPAPGQISDDVAAALEVIPASVQQFIERHVEQLSDQDQAILEAASVVGHTFSVAAVASAVELPAEAIETRCTAWVRHGQFLHAAETESWPDGTMAACYRFRHALYHEVMYRRVSAGQRVRLHHHIGTCLETGYGGQATTIAAELAVHFERGHDLQRAVFYLRQAADNAMQRSAYAHARTHLEHGLALVQNLPQAQARAQHELSLYLTLGTVLMATQGWAAPDVEHVYLRARGLCQQLGDAQHLLLALWGLVAGSVVRAEFQKTRTLCQELLQLAEEHNDPVFRMAAHMDLAGVAFSLGEFRLAHESFEHTDALYTPTQHRAHITRVGVDIGVFCRSWAPHTLWHLGYPDQARARSQEALTFAQELAHPFSQAIALVYMATLHQFCRDSAGVQAIAEDTLALCRAHGFTYYGAWALILQGWGEAVQESSAEGIARIRQGIEMLRATGGGLRSAYYRALLAEAYGAVGQFDTGCEVLAEAFADVQYTGECWWVAELHRLQGELLYRSTRPSQEATRTITACFQQALVIARCQQARTLELRAALSLSRLWLEQGKRGAAYQLLAPIYGWFTEGLDTADLQEAHTLLHMRQR